MNDIDILSTKTELCSAITFNKTGLNTSLELINKKSSAGGHQTISNSKPSSDKK